MVRPAFKEKESTPSDQMDLQFQQRRGVTI